MSSGRQMIPPKQERSEESTRRLLDAAVELVAEAGYAGMTLAATGDRAGYSRGRSPPGSATRRTCCER